MRARRRVVVACMMLLAIGCTDAGHDVAPPADEFAADAPSDVDAEQDADAHDAIEPAPEPVLHVVATLAPLADLVAQVGGERVAVRSLVPAGADSHTYEPRPSDIARLVDADAYVGIGLGLNDAALRLATEHLPAHAPVLRLGELALDADALVHDHTHIHDGHTHTHSRHDLGPNPHVWTSLRNTSQLVAAIAEELSGLDPDGADGYRRNAEAYRAELDALDRSIGVALDTVPPDNRTLLTYHDAWSYFARDYDLTFVAAVQPADYSEPSAAEVRAVIDLIRELDVPAVFGSEVFPSGVLETIAAETDAVYVADLADDVLPGEPGTPEHTYLELMRRNAVLIVDALGGDAAGL